MASIGGSLSGGDSSGGASIRAQPGMVNLFGALATLMK